MSIKQAFHSLAELLVKKIAQVEVDQLHDQVIALRLSDGSEILRLALMESHGTVGVTFNLEVQPHEAIQVWQFALEEFRNLTISENHPEGVRLILLESFFLDKEGIFYTGRNARDKRAQEDAEAIKAELENTDEKKIEQAERELEFRKRRGDKISFH